MNNTINKVKLVTAHELARMYAEDVETKMQILREEMGYTHKDEESTEEDIFDQLAHLQTTLDIINLYQEINGEFIVKIGLNEYQHEAGQCCERDIGPLKGHCGDPRCKLPAWIRTGPAAMLGTTHTTEGFATRKSLFNAISELTWIGKWSYFTEGQWSDRAQKMVKRYVGVIKNG